MRVSKTIKKIVALGVGATMMGATILGATAADLKDYPTFFVEDSTFNGALVVQGAEDSLAAVDIASNMKAKVAGSTSGGKVEVTGDVKQVGEAGDYLELYEDLGSVSSVLTGDDLDGLKSYKVTTDKGTTDVNQYLRLDSANLTNTSDETAGVQYDQSEVDDSVGDFLYWKDGDDIFEYELEFTDGLESDVVSAKLDDLEDKKITILGKEFIIVDTTVDVTSDDTVTLKLMGGAVRDVLNLDESKSFSIDGTDYEVSLSFMDSDECKFTVNGETTDLLNDGETDLLADGTQVGVSEVLYQDYAGGKQQCEFFLGADQIELTDNNFVDDAFDQSGVTANQEGIEDANVKIRATSANSNTTVEISEIRYLLKGDGKGGDDPWIPPGKGLRAYLDEPQGMLHSDWDITYKGFQSGEEETVALKLSGDDQYNIEFTNVAGKSYKVPFLNTEATFKYGDDDDNFWFFEMNLTGSGEGGHVAGNLGGNAGVFSSSGVNGNVSGNTTDSFPIKVDDFLLVSDDDVTAADEGTFSYVLRYDSIDKSDNKLTFTDLSGGSYEVTYSTANTQAKLLGGNTTDAGDEIQTGDLIVGGKVYKVLLSEDNSTNITVDLNQNGVIEGLRDPDGNLTQDASPDETVINSRYGMRIDLSGEDTPQYNGTSGFIRASNQGLTAKTNLNVTLLVESKALDEATVDERSQVNVMDTSSGTELDLDVPNANVSNLADDATMDNDEVKDEDRGMTKYGLLLIQKEEKGGTTNSELTVKVPKAQRAPLVYVELEGATTSVTEGGSEMVRVTVPVTATLLPSEVTKVGSQNLIAVGGPCANSVTAEVMYTKQGKTAPADCTEGFTPGEAVISLYDVDGKVAMVVAGYSGSDTRRAGKVLADVSKYSLSGKQVTVTGTTFKDISVSKVK